MPRARLATLLALTAALAGLLTGLLLTLLTALLLTGLRIVLALLAALVLIRILVLLAHFDSWDVLRPTPINVSQTAFVPDGTRPLCGDVDTERWRRSLPFDSTARGAHAAMHCVK